MMTLMVSIMPAFAATKLAFCLMLLAAMPVRAEFVINSAEIYLIKQGYLLDADINYQLNPRIIEAIDNGIPIVFLNTIEIQQKRQLLKGLLPWTSTYWKIELRYEIRYLALLQQFTLRDLNQASDQESFVSLNAALTAMGSLDSFPLPLLPTEDISNLNLRLRSSIDLRALPAPMQPGALISTKWHLTSAWVDAIWL